MSIVRYAAVLDAQPEGGYTVTFPDIPEAITEGDSRCLSWRTRWARRGPQPKSWRAHAPTPPSASSNAP